VFPETRAAFIAAQPSRWGKTLRAIDVFGVKGNYAGFVCIFNVGVDDSATQNAGVIAGPDDANLTFLGHETGHVFGLQHSFDESARQLVWWSAQGEYFDLHDIMSAMAVHSDGTMPYAPKGPLLNVVNLEIMDWLPPSRVLAASSGNSSQAVVFDLVSLSHPEIPGYLAAKAGDLYVEFRTNDRWDAAIPRPAVLIHRKLPSGVNSLVLASDKTTWNTEWQPGQTYSPDPVELFVNGGTRVFIESFDLSAKKARIRVQYTARNHKYAVGPGVVFAGVARGGDGWVLTPSGKLKRVPPHSPLIAVLNRVVDAVELEEAALSDGQRIEAQIAPAIAKGRAI
jgi:hypothetical protein